MLRGENVSPASDLNVRRFVSKYQFDFSLISSGVRTLPSCGKGTAGIVTTSHSYTSAMAFGRLGWGPMCCVSGTPGPASCGVPVDIRIFLTFAGVIGEPFFDFARP